ncbi:MAG: prenyltransferase [Candidatus Thermoplasmatota archaeon]|nr:prenyltransferase [Candidatus Thermoplasmatota archaeon]MBU1940258.1 prenyltransferase [Candidatus Thermoplasmatota archaeon]
MDFHNFVNIVKLGRSLAHAAMLVYFLGVLFALVIGSPFDIYKFVLGYLIVFISVLATGYTNNYYDTAIDKYATQTAFSGGSSILHQHPEYQPTIRSIIVFLYGLSMLLGFAFTMVFSYPWTFFAFVIIANFFGWGYTAPPLKLVYKGFGEFVTMLGASFLLAGSGYFVMRGTIDGPFVWFSIPLLLFGFAVSLYLEIPDRTVDRQGHKMTLVVMTNERFSFIISVISLGLATLCYMAYSVFQVFEGAPNFLVIAVFSFIPFGVGVWSLRNYLIDPASMMRVVFRATVSIFLMWIVLDVYFVYILLR